jgi:hypothetical protein
MAKHRLAIVIAAPVALLFAAAMGFFVYDWFWRAPQARATLPELRAELDRIPLPPDVHDVRHWESWKGGSALITLGFASDLSWVIVQRHYESELQRLGWTSESVKPVKIWGRDLGGKTQDFRKDRLTASLYYRGSDTRTPPYTLDISWGLH